MSGPAPPPPTAAVLVWGDAVEDFLAPLGVPVQTFATEMDGGWLFGYAEALRLAGVRVVIVCVSRDVRRPERFEHGPTGATVWALPLPRRYRALRRLLLDPYAVDASGAFPPGSRLPRWARTLARDAAPYLPVPLLPLARVLRRERAGALLVQEYEAARFDLAVVLGLALGVPVFASFQGGTWHVSRLERVLRPRSLAAAAGFVVPTASEADRLRSRYGVPEEKVARVFNPLDVRPWARASRSEARRGLGIPGGAEVVAWHGRVDLHRKGLDVLADAWDSVVAERPGRDLRLRLVGSGPDAGALRTRLERGAPGVTWRDEYVLDRDALREHLSAADAYVLPSRHEGFPVALVEALASGLPSAAADAPGVRDVLGAPPAGLVVPTGDSEALAAALGQLLDDPGLRSELARRAGTRAAATFAPEAVGASLRRFLFEDRAPAGGSG